MRVIWYWKKRKSLFSNDSVHARLFFPLPFSPPPLPSVGPLVKNARRVPKPFRLRTRDITQHASRFRGDRFSFPRLKAPVKYTVVKKHTTKNGEGVVVAVFFVLFRPQRNSLSGLSQKQANKRRNTKLLSREKKTDVQHVPNGSVLLRRHSNEQLQRYYNVKKKRVRRASDDWVENGRRESHGENSRKLST